MNLTGILQTVVLFGFIWRTGFVYLNKRISKMFLQSSLLHFDAYSYIHMFSVGLIQYVQSLHNSY